MLPTLASLTGATPTGKPLDGMDQSSTLRGGPPVRQDMFLGYSEGTRDRYDHPLNGAYSALRWKNWKIIRFPNFETFKLYNLNLDPRELNDLSSKKPSMVRFLQKRMEAYESGFLLSLTDQGGDDCTTDDLVFGTTPWGEPAWQPWCDLLEN